MTVIYPGHTTTRANADLDALAAGIAGANANLSIPSGLAITTLAAYLSNGQIFNPLNYGAVGDGVTDDTAALNATIIAASLVRGTVMLALGKSYYTTASVTMKNWVTLDGPGAVIVAANTTFQIINVPANTIGWAVRNIGIQGAAASGVLVTHAGVYVRITAAGASGSGVVDNVTFLNASNRGVSAAVKIESGNPYCSVTNNRVLGLYGLPASTGYGVLTTCDYTTIIGNTFAPPVGEGRNPIYLSGTATTGLRGIVVIGNRIIGFTNVAIASNGGGNGLRDSVISGNTIMDHAPTDLTMGAIGLYGACVNVAITGNVIDSTGVLGRGITVYGASDITSSNGQKLIAITGNTIRNVGAEAIAIYGLVGAGPYPNQYPSLVEISGNIIEKASTASPGTYSAIRVESANTGVIANNVIDGGTTLTLYGIAVSPGVPVANGWTISDNVIVNVVAAAGAGISDGGTHTYLSGNSQDGLQLPSSMVVTPASSAAGGAGLRILSGIAPTGPVNGDVWRDGVGPKMQLAGATKEILTFIQSPAIADVPANGAGYVQADVNKIVTAVNAILAVMRGNREIA